MCQLTAKKGAHSPALNGASRPSESHWQRWEVMGWSSLGRNLCKGLERDWLSGNRMRAWGTGTEGGGEREGPERLAPWLSGLAAFWCKYTWCLWGCAALPVPLGAFSHWKASWARKELVGFFLWDPSVNYVQLQTFLTPWLTYVVACKEGDSSLIQKLELIHSQLLALTWLHRRHILTEAQNSDIRNCCRILPE